MQLSWFAVTIDAVQNYSAISRAMPCILSLCSDGIYHCNEKTDLEELVSNFTVTVNGLVEVSKEAGGPGYLATITHFPDEMEK